MVSTRQMSTSGSATINTLAVNGNISCCNVAAASTSGGGGTTSGTGGGTPHDETGMRLSVVTRASQHHETTATAAISSLVALASKAPMNLLDLPTELLIKILSYVNFKKISQCRLVSTKMNDICMLILNSTFSKLITTTYNRFHAIKASMPRRESARRNHPLACECDIVETCYMRLSLLQMSLGKHIERGHCCFFPGAILDEVYTIMNYIMNTPHLQRPYRVTDELFDLSTMAMEYFRDRIEPTLPGIAYITNKDYYKLNTTTKRPSVDTSSDLDDNSLISPPQTHMVLRKGIRKIKQGMKIYNNQLSVLRTELRTCKRKSAEQGKQIAEQQKLLAEQQKQTLEYANRLDENDKKNEEMARKFSTLLQELNKCKTELQFWRSKSPAMPICISCNQKVTPILPAEDLQALVNQGVNPDDIIINMNDDTDTESDISCLSENQIVLEDSFVFPDETTTAKLLAMNTAAKNLKRKYIAPNNCATVQQSNGNIGNVLGSATTTTTSITTSNGITSNFYSECYNTVEVLEPIVLTTINNDIGSGPSTSKAAQLNNGNGYSPKSFYGNQNNIQPMQHQQNQRSGVIVSPVSVLKRTLTSVGVDSDNAGSWMNVAAVGGKAGETNLILHGDKTGVDTAGCDVATAAAAAASDKDEVLHETKKARRVQKATRCVNSNGKRSK